MQTAGAAGIAGFANNLCGFVSDNKSWIYLEGYWNKQV